MSLVNSTQGSGEETVKGISMRKRICVILAQLEEKTQKGIMEAFTKEAYAHDYDMCIFSMHQKYQDTDLRNAGDSNIYSLINFSLFDGVLLFLDTLLAPGAAESVEERIHQEFNGPVVVVDKESKYFDHVMMDHYTPIVKIVDHLIEVHGYTDIAFLGGKKGHIHSIQRLNGFMDSMRAHGLTVREDRVFHGDYWYDSGYKTADYLNEHRDDLPQVMVCANDYMAVGLASRLSEYGLCIPGDMALVGYDSNEEGRLAPVPLTSAEIPANSCGKMCFYKLHSAITGEEIPNIHLDYELFIGESCGCKGTGKTFVLQNRSEWRTDHSVSSFYSDMNHITEDMLCQKDYDKFFNILVRYTYQIRPFYRLWLCLNKEYRNPLNFIGEKAIIKGYADTMNMVVKCGEGIDPGDAVELDRSFSTDILLPELFEERDYPTTFVFTPMFFEDRCFGYSVLNQGPKQCIYDKTFRVWMRNVNQGTEAFYRQKALAQVVDRVTAEQVRDAQTGLYNYQGFHQAVIRLAEEAEKESELAIVAFDLENMKGLNEKYGRQQGDVMLVSLAKLISNISEANDVCGRLCNDEFLIGYVSADCEKKYEELVERIPQEGIVATDSEGNKICVNIHHAMKYERIEDISDFDFLINQTVNAKNHIKKSKMQKATAYTEMTPEEKAKCHRVEELLDNGDLAFHFQPIVSAKDGNVYGYEALMRDESESGLNPYEILQGASKLGRMYDIEKATFNGVLDRIEAQPEEFDRKKIFINSLPAYQLTGADEAILLSRLNRHRGNVVVEYTEDSEVSDELLEKHRREYSALNVDIALDDYGSGYSNTNNLLRYTPHYVKIDRALISGIDKNPQKRYFVKSIIDYSKGNDIMVLAEGVETAEELRTVIALGVDLIQGFYTGRPVHRPIKVINEEILAQIKRFVHRKEELSLFA